jgi:hypothetical protein
MSRRDPTATHPARCNQAARFVAVLLLLIAAAARPGRATPVGPTPAAKPSGAVGVTGAPGALGAAAKPPGAQAIRVNEVHIEGKLYSPQALFIVTRPAESFGRDAIVPAYLAIESEATALPYRLREPVLEAAGAALAAPASGPPSRTAPAAAPRP